MAAAPSDPQKVKQEERPEEEARKEKRSEKEVRKRRRKTTSDLETNIILHNSELRDWA